MERRGGHGGVLKARSCTIQQRSPCLCIRGEQERGGRKGRGGSCKTAAAALVQRDIKPLSSPWWGARPATSRQQATACAPPPAPPILLDPSRASLPPARQHPRVRVGLGVHPPDTHDGAGRPHIHPPRRCRGRLPRDGGGRRLGGRRGCVGGRRRRLPRHGGGAWPGASGGRSPAVAGRSAHPAPAGGGGGRGALYAPAARALPPSARRRGGGAGRNG